jgi:hypothetical protein
MNMTPQTPSFVHGFVQTPDSLHAKIRPKPMLSATTEAVRGTGTPRSKLGILSPKLRPDAAKRRFGVR